MRIDDLTKPYKKLSENASGGGTSAGSIASIPNGGGGPMLGMIKRMPAGQSFFGQAGTVSPKPKKKKSSKKRAK